MLESAPSVGITYKSIMHGNVHATKFDFEWIQKPHGKQMGFKFLSHIMW